MATLNHTPKASLKLPNKSGIYLITCTSNNKIYIGCAANFRKRWIEHKYELRHNKHYNKYLQRAWNKHGEQSFVISILEYCSLDQLVEREQFYIDTWQPFGDKGYNIARDATAPMLGLKHSPEAIRKVSLANKGRKRSPEFAAQISARAKQMICTPETRLKRSIAMKGRKQTPEHTAKRVASRCKSTFVVTSPDGEIIEVHNLSQLCSERGLGVSNMYNVARGVQKHHKGWIVKRIK